jgi:hypothetical protein
MSDIVQDIEIWLVLNPDSSEVRELLNDAQTEIERLRAELSVYKDLTAHVAKMIKAARRREGTMTDDRERSPDYAAMQRTVADAIGKWFSDGNGILAERIVEHMRRFRNPSGILRLAQHEIEHLERRVDALRVELASRDARHKAIMAEDCDLDEKHCTCVPLLREEIKLLREDLREMRKERDGAMQQWRDCRRLLREACEQWDRNREITIDLNREWDGAQVNPNHITVILSKEWRDAARAAGGDDE